MSSVKPQDEAARLAEALSALKVNDECDFLTKLIGSLHVSASLITEQVLVPIKEIQGADVVFKQDLLTLANGPVENPPTVIVANYEAGMLTRNFYRSIGQSSVSCVDSALISGDLAGRVDYETVFTPLNEPKEVQARYNGVHVATGRGQKNKLAKLAAADGIIQYLHSKGLGVNGAGVNKGYCSSCDCIVKMEGHDSRCQPKRIKVCGEPVIAAAGDYLYRYILLAMIKESRNELMGLYPTICMTILEESKYQAQLAEGIFGRPSKLSKHETAQFLEIQLVKNPGFRELVVLSLWAEMQDQKFIGKCKERIRSQNAVA